MKLVQFTSHQSLALRKWLVAASLMAAVALNAEVKINWLNSVDDFGSIREEDGKVALSFRGVNAGDEPLVIIKAKSTCGCTTPSFPRGEIAPADTFEVAAEFDPAFQVGKIEKKIHITTNAEPKVHTLTLTGAVSPKATTLAARYPVKAGSIRLNKAAIDFGNVVRGKAKMEYLEIYNEGDSTVTPRWLHCPKHLAASGEPVRLEHADRGIMSLYAMAEDDDSYGVYADTIDLAVDDSAQAAVVNIPVSVCFVEDFSFMTDVQIANAPIARASTDLISCGVVVPNAEGVSRSFKVENRGKSTLRIRRVYSSSPHIVVARHSNKVMTGKSTEIKFRISPSIYSPEHPLVDETITVVTNDPTTPILTVRVTAEYF